MKEYKSNVRKQREMKLCNGCFTQNKIICSNEREMNFYISGWQHGNVFIETWYLFPCTMSSYQTIGNVDVVGNGNANLCWTCWDVNVLRLVMEIETRIIRDTFFTSRTLRVSIVGSQRGWWSMNPSMYFNLKLTGLPIDIRISVYIRPGHDSDNGENHSTI